MRHTGRWQGKIADRQVGVWHYEHVGRKCFSKAVICRWQSRESMLRICAPMHALPMDAPSLRWRRVFSRGCRVWPIRFLWEKTFGSIQQ